MKLVFEGQQYLSGLGDVAPMDSKKQALLWQQAQYMSDSGIHSGMTTHAPSVSSKHGIDEMDTGNDMDAAQMMFGSDNGFNQGFTQEQVDGMF